MNKPSRIIFIPASYSPLAVSGETVSIPAGVAGTVVDFYLEKKPVGDSHGCYLGGDGDTSVVLTSTTFTNEVAYGTPDADMANGDYYIDYAIGKCRGKKADNLTSMTADYTIFQ